MADSGGDERLGKTRTFSGDRHGVRGFNSCEGAQRVSEGVISLLAGLGRMPVRKQLHLYPHIVCWCIRLVL